MADKACPYCAETIKAAAVRCRHCGMTLVAPLTREPAPARGSKLLRASAIVFGTTLVVYLIVIFADDKVAATRREGAAAAVSQEPREPERIAVLDVSADQLHKDYRANEVRADEIYRGKLLRVTGAVKAIKKDFTDQPYVEFWTTSEYEHVDARFPRESAATLSNLARGARIAVRCIGNNVVMNDPQLKGCVLE